MTFKVPRRLTMRPRAGPGWLNSSRLPATAKPPLNREPEVAEGCAGRISIETGLDLQSL